MLRKATAMGFASLGKEENAFGMAVFRPPAPRLVISSLLILD